MGKIYALIGEDNRVREIIKSEGVFENIPIEQRYPKEIVDKCVECNEDIKQGMDYNPGTEEFTEHIDESVEEEIVEEVEDNGEGGTGSKWSN